MRGKFPCCMLKQASGFYKTLLIDQAHDTAPAENINTTPFKFLEHFFFKEDLSVEASTPKLNFYTSLMFLAFVASLWKPHTTKRGSTLCDLHKTTRKWLSCFTEHKSLILYQQCMHRVFVFFLFLSRTRSLFTSIFFFCCTFGSGRVGLCWSSLEETLKRKETKKKKKDFY